MTKTNQKNRTERDDPHWIEWLTGALSALLVLAMLGWIVKEAIEQTGEPPELSIRITATEATRSGGHRVSFDIANASTSTAAGVTVRGELADGDKVLETSEVSFDYVPAESKTEGAILFAGDPAGRKMTVTVTGYTEP